VRRHALRLQVIGTLFGLSLVCLTFLLSRGVTEGTGLGAIASAVTLLGGAFMDALAVEKRRRTPGQKAISDDVS
jgi:hypothetical protein